MDRLKDKVTLISSGARGQGAAEARLFVAEGARVIIGDVLESQGHALAAEIGQSAAFIPHDVTKETDWQRAVDAAQALGGLHGMVNNAGIYQPRTLTVAAGAVALAAASFSAGTFAAQPHMDNALAALQTARSELQIAEHNKGGHRVNAIRLVDQAINEVRAGIGAGM